MSVFVFTDASSYQSMRATASHHHGAATTPEVHATIAVSKDDVSIRISDQGTSRSPPWTPDGLARMRKSDSYVCLAAQVVEYPT